MSARALRLTLLLVAALGVMAFAVVFLSSNDSSTEAESKADVLNRKRTVAGMPTLDPETVDEQRTQAAEHVDVDAGTPFPTRAPQPPSCGPTDGSAEILASYGGVVSGCDQLSATKVISTAGLDGGHGALAILECAESDRACIAGEEPSDATRWAIYQAPRPGPVKILSIQPEIIVVNNGGFQCVFDRVTHEFQC